MNEQIQEISVRDLHSFRNHPFQVKDDESLQALCDSIREYGILRGQSLKIPDTKGAIRCVPGTM